MEDASRGWTSCFISSHSSEAGWRLGQGSRTSTSGKGRVNSLPRFVAKHIVEKSGLKGCVSIAVPPPPHSRLTKRKEQTSSGNAKPCHRGTYHLRQLPLRGRHSRLPVLTENRHTWVQTGGELVPNYLENTGQYYPPTKLQVYPLNASCICGT